MTRRAVIRIDFQSYWLAGTGAGLGRTADVNAYRVDDWPAIPMTQVKGTLRETAEYLCASGAFGEEQFDTIFGNDNIEASVGFDGDAVVPQRLRTGIDPAMLFTRIPSTQVSETGIAVDRSLRAIEVARPVRLEGTINWSEEDDFVEALDLICKATLAVGKLKTGGYGDAILSCQWAQEPSEPAPPRIHGAAKDQCRQSLRVFLTARQNMQFGRQPGTEGVQRTLSHPTGASLLGWCARKYSEFDDKTAVFHSGAVRFGAALPAVASGEVIPIPKTFAAPKDSGGAPFDQDGQIDRNLVRHGRPDYADCVDDDSSVQFEPVKRELMTTGLRLVQTKLGARVRTAVKNRRAAEGKLFTAQHIEAIDETFMAVIEFGDSVTEKDKTRIADCLSQSGIRLGRDKRTGGGGLFDGAVRWEDAGNVETVPLAAGQRFAVLCLSDLAATDQFGLPAPVPAPETMGIRSATLLRDRSIITYRRYAPWNALFECPIEERTVIEAGSVLTYRVNEGEDISVETRQTIGQHQETGLGRIWIEPWFLKSHEIDAPPVTNGTGTPRAPERVEWAATSADGDDDWISAMARYVARYAGAGQ